eukprot:CAMPEP_0115844906 /NCGR_PEP_ID=MMETSP0287-20121206/9069_1 /TAXON_ID=412157 /ORGANISM="Chrysochromulina rotalis, Strain UIO044" /LENGTH=119 /DNA_ID=CAMNT_0003298645 /DNA_START=17 /DNA_END=373 /DNA_ORIENTATION=-
MTSYSAIDTAPYFTARDPASDNNPAATRHVDNAAQVGYSVRPPRQAAVASPLVSLAAAFASGPEDRNLAALIYLALDNLEGGAHPRAARALHARPAVVADACGTLEARKLAIRCGELGR